MDISWLSDFFSTTTGPVAAIRAIVTIPFLIFIPGYFTSRIFFDKLSVAERFTISIGLSIALVVLCIIAANQVFHIHITTINIMIIILTISVFTASFCLLKKRICCLRRDTEKNRDKTD